MENALAPSTRSSYSTAWSSFTNFCEQNRISYTSYNLQLLLAFIAHLRLSLRLAPSSIRCYLAGIQYQFRLQSIPSPLLSSVPEIRLTLRGMEKSLPPSSPSRQPISTDLLLHLIIALRQGCFNPFDDIVMETLCLIAFFGFLRCSEFSTPSTSSFPALGLKRSDLSQIPGNHFILHIRSSKTDQLSQGSVHRYHPCADSGGAKMNTHCPLKCVPSAARFFTLCRLTVLPPQSYSVGGQRSSGQLTGKPAGARPDYRGRCCAVSRGHPGRTNPHSLPPDDARPIERHPLGAPVHGRLWNSLDSNR
ncbi:UNVERIFIED_CONTAM: hypothetical protein FKN15_005459 [Acipenser sinensis]